MKRWAWIIAGLYVLILGALTAPAILLAFAPRAGWKDAAEAYGSWQYWLWLAVMLASQAALLTVPVRIASRRPITRGPLWPTLLAGGLMMGGLVAGAACCFYEFFFHDKGNIGWIAWLAVALGGVTWSVWLLVFFRMSQRAAAS